MSSGNSSQNISCLKSSSGLRIILMVLPFFYLTLSLSAQSFKGGVHGGLVASQVAGDKFSGYNKAGISAGGWVSLQVTPRSVLQMELAYVQKGSRENPDYEKNRMQEYLMRLGYVELPVLYRLIYSDKLNFEIGPAMNFLIHSYEEADGYIIDYGFKNTNLALIIGLSYNLNEKLRVNFRTNNSIFNIRNEKVDGDVWRFFDHGQFSDALILSLYYQL